MRRVSPAQLPPDEGVNGDDVGDPKGLEGGSSFGHPLFVANGDPYPPIPAVEILVVVVADSPNGLAAFGGIAGVFAMVMLS